MLFDVPKVTLAFGLLREIEVIRGLSYFVVQMIGAMIGAALVKALVPLADSGHVGATVRYLTCCFSILSVTVQWKVGKPIYLRLLLRGHLYLLY